MEPSQSSQNWKQLNTIQLYDRFQPSQHGKDIYQRPYILCIDKVTSKLAVIREYYNSDCNLEDILLDVENFVRFSEIWAVCKMICYSHGTGKFNMAFDYSECTLEEYLKDPKKELQKSEGFLIALFFDLVSCFEWLYKMGYEYDDVRRESVLVQELGSTDIVFKIYIDQRPKLYQNLDLQTALHSVYYSPEKLELIKNPQLNYSLQKICVFQIALLILDAATQEIENNFYNVMGVNETGMPYLVLNDEVIDAKLQLLDQKFLDKTIGTLVRMGLEPYEKRTSLESWHDQARDIVPPTISASLRCTSKEYMSIMRGKNDLEQLELTPSVAGNNEQEMRNRLTQSQTQFNSPLNDQPIIDTNIATTFCVPQGDLNRSSSEVQYLKQLIKKIPTRQQIKTLCSKYITNLLNVFTVACQKYPDGSLYIGQMINEAKHGEGIFVYSNRAIYYGKFNNNRKYEGTCIYNNGESYSGSFKGGKCGKGVYHYSNGDVYEGDWQNDIKHGRGRFMFKNGDVYEGEWVNDKKHGVGEFRNTNGVFYQGGYYNGHKKGECEILFPDGRKLHGDWDQIKQGLGAKFVYQNGDTYEGPCRSTNGVHEGIFRKDSGVYEGTFVNGVPNGFCNISYKNGEKYSGEVVNGIKQGQGVYIYSNGDEFKGEWGNNMKISGTYTFGIGNRFTGSFIENQIANGVMEYSSGDRYEGEFIEGLREGAGKYTSANGTIAQGQWKQDSLIHR